MPDIKLGANLACLAPVAAWRTQAAIDALAQMEHLDVMMGIPLIGALRARWPVEKPMMFLEDGWECDPWWELLNPYLRRPILIYRTLFGSPARQRRCYKRLKQMPGHPAKLIVHDEFVPGTFLEPHGGMLMGTKKIRALMPEGQDLVLDLNHLDKIWLRPDQVARLARDRGQSYEDAFADYGTSLMHPFEKSVDILLNGFSGKVVIHAAPDRDNGEYERILNGVRDTRFFRKLNYVLERCQPEAIIAEVVPTPLSRALRFQESCRNLEKFLGILRQHVDHFYA